MVHNANRKLSNGDLNSERRKSSVFDVLKFVNFGKAEIQKRRMVRFWKQKAREKVVYIIFILIIRKRNV